jgi:5-methylthioadenosine/S-adenosylhomocysteine deaminase
MNTIVDLLIRHAYVLTMNEEGQTYPDGALAVHQGKIVAVGPDADLAVQYQASRVLDAEGRALLPGLINCHTHVPMTLFRGIADDKELMDWLNNYIFPAESKAVDADFVRVGTRLALYEMLRGGTTTIVDMYMFEHVVAEELDRVGMRGILGQAVADFPIPGFPTWHSMMEGCEKFVSDWKSHPRISAALAPHAPYTVGPDHLKECQALATRLECPLLIHLSETSAENQQIKKEHGDTPVRYLDSLGLLTPRLIAAHMVWPDDAEIALLAQKGVGVGHCPQSNAKLASGIAPVIKMLKAGVRVGLGTDGAASNNDLDMWQEMQTAAFLQKVANNDATAMSARQTLELATSSAARAAHLEKTVGQLAVGKQADLVLVRLDAPHQIPVYNPTSQLVYTTKSTDVDYVFIDGKPVVELGKVLGIDEAELRYEVAEQSRRVRKIIADR